MLTFFGRFMKDRRGGFAVQTALAAPVFVLAMGGAIEYARAYSTRVEVRNAVDTATLSGTRMLALEPNSSDSDIVDLVRRQFQASEVARRAQVTCDAAAVNIDRVNVSVNASISCTMNTLLPTTLTDFTLTRSAQSEMNFDSLDVAFMLDVSGSMRGQKLRDLQDAVKDAFDVFLLNSRSNVRIALAPYSTGLNAGSYAEAATGEEHWVRQNRDGTFRDSRAGRRNSIEVDCVTERTGSHAFTDRPTTTQLFGRGAPTPNVRFSSYDEACNPAQIMPLTSNRAQLRSAVNSYTAVGGTAGHLGIAWSWYLVSPSWSNFWPAASRPLPNGDGRKAVIIMTDGMFNWEYERSRNGDSESQATALCTAMKNAGVLVFSVGFQAPNSVKGTLRNCATTPTYFFDSASRDELKDAYKAIAEELSTHVLVQ